MTPLRQRMINDMTVRGLEDDAAAAMTVRTAAESAELDAEPPE